MYHPTLGRWMNLDPVSYGAGDANLYRAYGNSPVGLLDPSGLEAVKPTIVSQPRKDVGYADMNHYGSRGKEFVDKWKQLLADESVTKFNISYQRGEYDGGLVTMLRDVVSNAKNCTECDRHVYLYVGHGIHPKARVLGDEFRKYLGVEKGTGGEFGWSLGTYLGQVYDGANKEGATPPIIGMMSCFTGTWWDQLPKPMRGAPDRPIGVHKPDPNTRNGYAKGTEGKDGAVTTGDIGSVVNDAVLDGVLEQIKGWRAACKKSGKQLSVTIHVYIGYMNETLDWSESVMKYPKDKSWDDYTERLMMNWITK